MQRALLLAVVFGAGLSSVAFVSAKTCPNEGNKRIDCLPEGGTEATCNSRGCCWQPPTSTELGLKISEPTCFFPTDYDSYAISDSFATNFGHKATLKFTGNVDAFHRAKLISTLALEVRHYPNSKIVRLTIKDPADNRYVVPDIEVLEETPVASPAVFATNLSNGSRSFTISDANGRVLFDSSAGPLIYADQFIQLSTRIESDFAYGFGEVSDVFAKPTSTWRQYSLFAADLAPNPGVNVYGVHPFGMFMRKADASSHGIFLLNSNAMDIEVTPYPAVTFRTIGGIIDLFLYAGATPAEVVQQHLKVIGNPIMPPYWSLGFQLSRWGYNTKENLELVVDRNVAAKIPYDVQWFDIDTFEEKRDWTYDPVAFKNLPDLVDKLHKQNMFVVPIVDPAIQTDKAGYSVYEDGLKMNVFMLDNDNEVLVGKVWPGNTAFPDFTHPNTPIWWHDDAKKYYTDSVKFDGLWIDMNEPANFVHGSNKGCQTDSKYDKPIYVPNIVEGRTIGLHYKTVCMSAKHREEVHYNLHSLYGHIEARVTNEVIRKIIPGKRPFVVSRSTFPGTGRYAHHWTGDVTSKWDHLGRSIGDMLNFNLFGIPYVGADICGFFDNSTEELCIRWMQVGSFYPFMRNHNGFGYRDQDPAAWSLTAQDIMRKNLEDRYRMLPYFYSLFFRSNLYGETVLRPLFWNFPSDKNTLNINNQFMLGDAILVSPVVSEGATKVSAYVPHGTWYTLDGTAVPSSGQTIDFNAPLSTVPIHIRGGYILPFQHENVTTTDSRKNPYYIVAALGSGSAVGELFIDDGVSDALIYSHIKFTAGLGFFQSRPEKTDYKPSSNGYSELVTSIKVFGASQPYSMHINGVATTYNYNAETKVLDITINASILSEFSVTWVLSGAQSVYSQVTVTLLAAAVALFCYGRQ